MIHNLAIFFSLFATAQATVLSQRPLGSVDETLNFELRHEHAASSSSGAVVFRDAPQARESASPNETSFNLPRISLRTRPTRIQRPPSFVAHEQVRARRSQQRRSFSPLYDYHLGDSLVDEGPGWWDEDEVLGPDITSRDVLLTLAEMTSNAYLINSTDKQWYDLGEGWSTSYPFGWEPDQKGFRGHVFATPDNSTVVVSIKGTSTGWLGNGGPTSEKDKKNDNLLFSCCCAYVDWSWSPICDCPRGGWKCDQDCLEGELIHESLFYPVGTNLYNNLTYMYPTSNIWITGHSLGGSLASLIGVTFGAPVVAFEAPGERLAAQRLHLPSPPSTQHITHVYNNADPIPMGTCNGVLSTCAKFGFAFETHCHLGRSIVYDAVGKKGWYVYIGHHPIEEMISILNTTWAPAEEEGREVPEAKPEDDCVECFNWEFGDYPKKKDSDSVSP